MQYTIIRTFAVSKSGMRQKTKRNSVKIVQRQNNFVKVLATKAGNYSVTAKAKDGSGVEDTYSLSSKKHSGLPDHIIDSTIFTRLHATKNTLH